MTDSPTLHEGMVLQEALDHESARSSWTIVLLGIATALDLIAVGSNVAQLYVLQSIGNEYQVSKR